jgi:adenylate cyclase
MSQASTILVVDDEPFNRDVLVQQLEALGCRTVEARNGREAMASVARQRPDLILLDAIMPIMDGLQTLQALKAGAETQHIPVIMLTALHGLEDRIRFIEAGAYEFLTKPVDDRELQVRIVTAVRTKQAIDQRLRRVEQVRDHYANFVPDLVQRLVAENPRAPELATRHQDAAFIFADISGYTRLSETLASDELSRLVERYFSAFLDQIHHFDGEIGNTSGDGLLALYHRIDPASHSRLAAETALSLMDVTAELNARAQGPPVAIHVGLSSGSAAVGTTRFEGRRGARWVYTGVGHVLNLGSRIADLAKAGEILVCPESARRLFGIFALYPVGRHRLKNIADEVEIARLDKPGGISGDPT